MRWRRDRPIRRAGQDGRKGVRWRRGAGQLGAISDGASDRPARSVAKEISCLSRAGWRGLCGSARQACAVRRPYCFRPHRVIETAGCRTSRGNGPRLTPGKHAGDAKGRPTTNCWVLTRAYRRRRWRTRTTRSSRQRQNPPDRPARQRVSARDDPPRGVELLGAGERRSPSVVEDDSAPPGSRSPSRQPAASPRPRLSRAPHGAAPSGRGCAVRGRPAFRPPPSERGPA